MSTAARANVAATPASFEAWLRSELVATETPRVSRAPDLGVLLEAIARELLPLARSER